MDLRVLIKDITVGHIVSYPLCKHMFLPIHKHFQKFTCLSEIYLYPTKIETTQRLLVKASLSSESLFQMPFFPTG